MGVHISRKLNSLLLICQYICMWTTLLMHLSKHIVHIEPIYAPVCVLSNYLVGGSLVQETSDVHVATVVFTLPVYACMCIGFCCQNIILKY